MNCKFYTNVQVIGDSVLVREVVDGIPSMRKDKWSPSLYVKGKPTNYSGETFNTLYGDVAYELKPGSIRETKDFVTKYKDVSGFEIFGQLNYPLQYMNLYPVSNWNVRYVNVWAIDIETTIPTDAEGKPYFPNPKNVDGEILLITMVNMNSGEAFTFGSRPYSGNDTHYTCCANEKQLLQLFLQFWEQRKVDIVTGWNTNQFDLPYIINRVDRILGESMSNKLSPWDKTSCRIKEYMGKEEFQVDILGVSCLDYIDLYKKYIFVKQESYSLGHIAQEELGTTKVDHSEYGSFTDFYSNNFEKFAHYNVVDTMLIKQLDDKLKLIELVMTVAYEAKVNYSDTSSPVKTWDAIINNYCLTNRVVLPQQKKGISKSLDGAYVKDPVPGWYKNIVSLDATSLYPSIIMTNNIGPETYLGSIDMDIDTFLKMSEHGVEEENIVTPVGAIYSKEKRGVLPTLVERFMKMRRDAKNEMLRLEQELENVEEHDPKQPNSKQSVLENQISALNNKQMAIKILLNSLYGATANEHFRFYKWDHAASITQTGQFVLKTIEKNIDVELNKLFKTAGEKYLVYIDTDSLYFSLDTVFKKYNVVGEAAITALEKMSQEKLAPLVNKICQQCCEYMHSYENKISFKTELAASRGIFLGKKKYVLKAHSSEGVTFSKPKFKAKGLEMVRSSTPRFVKDKLKLALDVIFDTDETGTQKFIQDVKDEFMSLSYKQIAFPRGANNLQEYSSKTTIYTKEKSVPIQVRAVLLYNYYLKHFNVDGKYPSIGEGDKIKFLYLKTPNKFRENIMAFPAEGEIPVEFGILDKVNYELQFEKTFLSAMEIILQAIGWKAEAVSDLSEFF